MMTNLARFLNSYSTEYRLYDDFVIHKETSVETKKENVVHKVLGEDKDSVSNKASGRTEGGRMVPETRKNGYSLIQFMKVNQVDCLGEFSQCDVLTSVETKKENMVLKVLEEEKDVLEEKTSVETEKEKMVLKVLEESKKILVYQGLPVLE